MSGRPRVLVTLADTADPVDTGKRLRAASVLRALAGIAELDVLVLFADHPPALRPVPADVAVRSWSVVPDRRVGRPRGLAGVLRGRPWRIAGMDWRAAAAETARLVGAGRPDLVWFGSLDHFAVLGDLVRGAPCVVDYDDVEPAKIDTFLRLPPASLADRARRLQRRVERPLWRHLERRAGRRAGAVVVCSELDVRRLGLANAAAVPNTCPDPGPRRRTPPPGDRPVFLTVANHGYEPNVDAARFLAGRVLPALRRRVPGAGARIAGRHSATALADLAATPGLDLVGAVPEVGPLLDAATAVVVPVRYGGGTRLKAVEAFAHGVPVVSTRFGVEGLDVTDGVDVLLADDTAGLADACARVAADPDLAAALGAAGRRRYERAYRPEAATDAMVELIRGLLAGRR